MKRKISKNLLKRKANADLIQNLSVHTESSGRAYDEHTQTSATEHDCNSSGKQMKN